MKNKKGFTLIEIIIVLTNTTYNKSKSSLPQVVKNMITQSNIQYFVANKYDDKRFRAYTETTDLGILKNKIFEDDNQIIVPYYCRFYGWPNTLCFLKIKKTTNYSLEKVSS